MINKLKQLYLMRHGEAEWNQAQNDDIGRKLTENGIKQATQMARYLKENRIKLDLILSSPANRALMTAEIIKDHLHLPQIQIINELYPCNGDGIFNSIISLDDNINNVLIVGHNPGLNYFAKTYMQYNHHYEFYTAAIINCEYKTNSWTEFALVEAKMNFITSPK